RRPLRARHLPRGEGRGAPAPRMGDERALMTVEAPQGAGTLETTGKPPAAAAEGLTICSVSYRSRPFLELNHDLVRRCNQAGPPFRWVVVENTPPGEGDALEEGDARFDVKPGLPPPSQKKGRNSYHHGLALNEALRHVTSRFVLVLDPDFYLV